jgi:hypothetical protein
MRISHLSLTVEVGGAEWVMGQPDHALARMASLVTTLNLRPEDLLPPEAAALLPDLFIEGLCGWRNVEGPDGQPLPFNSRNVALIPTELKLEVAQAYLEERKRLQGEELPPAMPPSLPSEDEAPAT